MRSAGGHSGNHKLRAHVLSDSYERAWAEWEADASAWETVSADGLDGSR